MNTSLSTDQITDLGEKHRATKTADLILWSRNYTFGQRPYDAFLDLTGIYADEMGDLRFYQPKPNEAGFAYVELDYIGKALVEYADNPANVMAFIEALDELEQDEASEGVTEMIRVSVEPTYTPAPIPAVAVEPKENVFGAKCGECGRVFDLLNKNDALEWTFGHDCEAN
jgi:hypothetical protein